MKVSVALCTYNGQKYIQEQLKSICQQTRQVDEIILCDDRSTDQTVEVCRDILEKEQIPFVIKINDTSLNVLRNFQQCYALCSGDIIFSCDQDDVWEANKVEFMLESFQDPTINMVAGNASLIDEHGDDMRLSLRDSIGFTAAEKHLFLSELLRTFCITGATMAFRKSFEQQHLYMSKFWLHDGMMAIAAACNNQLVYLDQSLTKYRLHGHNVCGVGDVDILKDGTIAMLKKRKSKRLLKTAVTCPYYFEDLALENRNRYQEVLDHIKSQGEVKEANLLLMMDCIVFWEKRASIADMNFKQCKQMISSFVKDGSYEKYSESCKFRFYDWYFWLIYHIRPRKRS